MSYGKLRAALERPRPISELIGNVLETNAPLAADRARRSKDHRQLCEYRAAASGLRRLAITWILFMNRPPDYIGRRKLGVPLT